MEQVGPCLELNNLFLFCLDLPESLLGLISTGKRWRPPLRLSSNQRLPCLSGSEDDCPKSREETCVEDILVHCIQSTLAIAYYPTLTVSLAITTVSKSQAPTPSTFSTDLEATKVTLPCRSGGPGHDGLHVITYPRLS